MGSPSPLGKPTAGAIQDRTQPPKRCGSSSWQPQTLHGSPVRYHRKTNEAAPPCSGTRLAAAARPPTPESAAIDGNPINPMIAGVLAHLAGDPRRDCVIVAKPVTGLAVHFWLCEACGNADIAEAEALR